MLQWICDIPRNVVMNIKMNQFRSNDNRTRNETIKKTMQRILQNKLKSLRKFLAKQILDKKSKSQKTLDINQIKSVLFFRNDDKIGDMVVSTSLFREIKQKYPDIEIIVLCGKNNKEIIKYNKNIDKIYKLEKSFFKNFSILKNLRKQNISLAIDFYTFGLVFKPLLMLRIISPKFLIGFYKNSYNVYDLSIDMNFFNKHISKRYEYLLKILKIENPDLKYDVILSEKEEKVAFALISKYNAKYKIILNPFAASKHRSFDFDKLKELVNLLERKIDCCVFVLCQEKDRKKIESLQTDKTCIASFESVLESVALVKYSDAVISPDTSMVHIATAFDKKTVALYLDYSNVYEKINIIWGSNNLNAIQLSVDTKNKSVENDIKNIDNIDILNALQNILRRQFR
ncbi:MAG: glycosyltransferase family 9 protein [Endomicrobium sp.]|nr:glycosyltransferase family 9 protein [Endomicrobium sp.]